MIVHSHLKLTLEVALPGTTSFPGFFLLLRERTLHGCGWSRGSVFNKLRSGVSSIKFCRLSRVGRKFLLQNGPEVSELSANYVAFGYLRQHYFEDKTFYLFREFVRWKICSRFCANRIRKILLDLHEQNQVLHILRAYSSWKTKSGLLHV